MKRLQGKLGFLGANLVQSLLFGLIHAFYVYPNNWLPKSYGYHGLYQSHRLRFGAINEKKAGGSILPSVFIHALANTVVGLLFAFSSFR